MWIPLTMVLVCATSYGLFVVLPYYVNNLDRFALSEVASGFHDPKDLWPRDTAVGGTIWGLGGLFTLLTGPLVAIAVPAWAAVSLWRHRSVLTTRGWLSLGMAVLCGVALMASLVSPFGRALTSWWLD